MCNRIMARPPATILVVDDEPLFVNAVSLMLKKHGYDVLKADGPCQALEIVRYQAPIEVVLSDVWMPEMLGTDLVRELAQMVPQTACILMTASVTQPQGVPQCVPLLRKPISIPDLIAAVKDAVARSDQLRAKLREPIEDPTNCSRRPEKLSSECKRRSP